jgi:hypothetical protein
MTLDAIITARLSHVLMDGYRVNQTFVLTLSGGMMEGGVFVLLYVIAGVMLDGLGLLVMNRLFPLQFAIRLTAHVVAMLLILLVQLILELD